MSFKKQKEEIKNKLQKQIEELNKTKNENKNKDNDNDKQNDSTSNNSNSALKLSNLFNNKLTQYKSNNNSSSDVKSSSYHGAIVPDKVFQQKQKEEKAKGNGLISADSPLGKLLNRFKTLGRGENGRYTESHFKHTTIDMLGYKRLTDDRNHFLVLANSYNEDNGYAEILKIGGASLSDLPSELIKLILGRFIGFLRSFLPDIEFISIPLPNNSKNQQRQWTIELNNVNNKLIRQNELHLSEHQKEQLFAQRDLIKESLSQFKQVDQNLYNQGFALMIFDTTEKKLKIDVEKAFRFGEDALNLSKMTVQEKEVFLNRLNNPNIGQ